jgi:hypothetical protein
MAEGNRHHNVFGEQEFNGASALLRDRGSMEFRHQLMVFEAFEHGLPASWETPGALVCVQRSA